MSRYKRKRCECGKAIFATREEAHYNIGMMLPNDKHPDLLSIYRCEFLKAGWHLGHNHKKYEAFEKGNHDPIP
jgi:hypothetical protein